MALHHYVPQFHQRLFRPHRLRGRVWRYDKESQRCSLEGISKSMAIRNYYSIPGEGGTVDDHLETMLSQIEGQAAKVIKVLIGLADGEWDIHENDILAMSMYLGTLYLRGPSQRTNSDALATWTTRVFLDMEIARADWVDRKLAADPGLNRAELEQAKEHWEEGRIIVETDPAQSLLNLQIGLEGVTPILAQRRWHIFKRPNWPYLVMGDQPVTIFRPAGLAPYRGAGPATPGVEIFCPLDPEHLLVVEDAPHDGKLHVKTLPSLRHSMEATWAQIANDLTWASARRYIVARSQADLEFTLLGIDPSRRNLAPVTRVSGGVPERWRKLLPDEMRFGEYPISSQ